MTVNVKAVMDTWTSQAGFPVVHASVIGRRVKLRQERFLLHGRANNVTRDYKYARPPSALPRDAMLARYMVWPCFCVRVCVCVSVCVCVYVSVTSRSSAKTVQCIELIFAA